MNIDTTLIKPDSKTDLTEMNESIELDCKDVSGRTLKSEEVSELLFLSPQKKQKLEFNDTVVSKRKVKEMPCILGSIDKNLFDQLTYDDIKKAEEFDQDLARKFIKNALSKLKEKNLLGIRFIQTALKCRVPLNFHEIVKIILNLYDLIIESPIYLSQLLQSFSGSTEKANAFISLEKLRANTLHAVADKLVQISNQRNIFGVYCPYRSLQNPALFTNMETVMAFMLCEKREDLIVTLQYLVKNNQFTKSKNYQFWLTLFINNQNTKPREIADTFIECDKANISTSYVERIIRSDDINSLKKVVILLHEAGLFEPYADTVLNIKSPAVLLDLLQQVNGTPNQQEYIKSVLETPDDLRTKQCEDMIASFGLLASPVFADNCECLSDTGQEKTSESIIEIMKENKLEELDMVKVYTHPNLKSLLYVLENLNPHQLKKHWKIIFSHQNTGSLEKAVNTLKESVFNTGLLNEILFEIVLSHDHPDQSARALVMLDNPCYAMEYYQVVGMHKNPELVARGINAIYERYDTYDQIERQVDLLMHATDTKSMLENILEKPVLNYEDYLQSILKESVPIFPEYGIKRLVSNPKGFKSTNLPLVDLVAICKSGSENVYFIAEKIGSLWRTKIFTNKNKSWILPLILKAQHLFPNVDTSGLTRLKEQGRLKQYSELLETCDDPFQKAIELSS